MANYARFGDSAVLQGGGLAVALDPTSGISVSVLPAGTQVATPTAVAYQYAPPPGALPITSASAPASDLPLASMAVVGLAGYFLGKKRGEGKLWGAVGAGLGWYFRPIG